MTVADLIKVLDGIPDKSISIIDFECSPLAMAELITVLINETEHCDLEPGTYLRIGGY